MLLNEPTREGRYHPVYVILDNNKVITEQVLMEDLLLGRQEIRGTRHNSVYQKEQIFTNQNDIDIFLHNISMKKILEMVEHRILYPCKCSVNNVVRSRDICLDCGGSLDSVSRTLYNLYKETFDTKNDSFDHQKFIHFRRGAFHQDKNYKEEAWWQYFEIEPKHDDYQIIYEMGQLAGQQLNIPILPPFLLEDIPWRKWLVSPDDKNKGEWIETYWKFHHDSAYCWAGPFCDAYACMFCKSFDAHEQKWYCPLNENEKANKRTYCSNSSQSPDDPDAIYLCGNDDCSYTRTYRNEEELAETLAEFLYLEINGGIDGFCDVQFNGFEFTN